MSIITALHHISSYHYDKPAVLGMQTIRLRPAPHVRSNIQAYSLKVEPKPHYINWHQDPFGNFLAKIVFPNKVSEFKIEVDLLTEIRAFNPFDFFLEDEAKDFPFDYGSDLKEELSPYLEIKESPHALHEWLHTTDQTTRGTIDFLADLNRSLNTHLQYTVRIEPGVQSCETTLTKASGSCRDMAWLLCQALRHLGLATRFVSGYLIQLKPDVKSLDGPSGTEVDFTDLHAWTEVYLPGAGWVGLDPTSGLFAGEGHIPLCCTPSPLSAAPVSGTLEANIKASFDHTMTVTRITEAPRVTKPYSESQWEAIDQLGKAIDTQLEEQEIELTMGGEPTFVSIDDREHDAWHFDALGGDKNKLGRELFERLSRRFATGGLPIHAQGKWYPGEILPRWALNCYWRLDEKPIWRDQTLLAAPEESKKHSTETAKKFLSALAESFGIPDSYVLPAREDTPYYLWKDHRLPLADEMMEADVYEKTERTRLQQLMDGDLNEPAGYVLPLHYSHRRHQWISNRWQFKSGHLILLTGDSPVGLRLPLGSLPTVEETEQEVPPERSPFEARKPLVDYASEPRSAAESSPPVQPDDKAFKDDPNGLICTAICAEARSGVLHLFLPPISHLERYLEMIHHIEQVAKATATAVVLEGYSPPGDERITSFSVTPDPGVLEINVQPASNWEELKSVSQTVFEEAREARLSAEKFLMDGRRVGTGGGNHIVMGASSPSKSPFLRRPDLLRSMVTFWQNHPSLSYLFSGLYIGPTSQSPRIDEARHDSLYELEIAFDQIAQESDAQPWVVDRLFRNLLVDLTGNTHRAEFCIDKLFSPDSERGRLGLLEMRGFEMPPHPQMHLLQALLLRACIAVFWKKPYEEKLIRWGTQLHDKFMLPYHLWEDFQDALHTLRVRGADFSPDWFEAFKHFRFPKCGSMQIDGVTLSLYTALEPWPVMGEESSGGGVSRAVDATVERLQLEATGINTSRHIVTCNGRRVPLTPTKETGLHVGGVRFKAWSQPSSLHPKLPENVPLVFDLVDTRQQRSLGGCTYHAAHPGGRNYETFPVNENEADGRRLACFEAIGHTPGKKSCPPTENNREFPHTLDLRFPGR